MRRKPAVKYPKNETEKMSRPLRSRARLGLDIFGVKFIFVSKQASSCLFLTHIFKAKTPLYELLY